MTEPAPETGASPEPQPAQPKRFLFLRRKAEAGPSPAVAAEAVVVEAAAAPDPDGAGEPPAEHVRPGVLRRRRRQLDDAYQQALFNLGGLAMELYSRGLLVEDVMRRKAAEVEDIRQQRDDLGLRIDEIRQERQARRQSGRRSTVTCPACGTRSFAGANFCSACGTALVVPAAEVAEGDADQATVIIEEAVVEETDSQPTEAIPPAREDDA